jgi:FAD/FMN-containing dehydrogenase
VFVRPGSAGADEFECDAAVYGPLQQIGGSVSAEHGIGLAKKRWLSCSRSPAEVSLMRTLKRALDPAGILNPGCVVDP